MSKEQLIRDEARRRLAKLHDGHDGSDVPQKAINSVVRHLTSPSPATIKRLRQHLAIIAAAQALHKIEADDITDDRHWPAVADEARSVDQKAVKFAGSDFVVDPARLALAVSVASAAMAMGVQAGDKRWHRGESDFEVKDTRGLPMAMDAPTVIAFGLAALNT